MAAPANLADQTDSDLAIAIEKLIKYDRPVTAIRCLYVESSNNKKSDTDQCIRALLAALSSREPFYPMDRYHIVKLIEFLQEDLLRIEWKYLPLLDNSIEKVKPQSLERRLANNPEFFCKMIQQSSREPTTETEAAKIANAYRLLSKWKIPPGTQQDKMFSEEHFTKWLQRVKVLCIKSGHLEVALIHIGQVLIHAPADPDGLWIHRAVATALNDRTNDELRDGFSMGKFNSRGAHWIDSTGKPEKELAEPCRGKAEEIENAGFHRLTMRKSVVDRLLIEHQASPCGERQFFEVP